MLKLFLNAIRYCFFSFCRYIELSDNEKTEYKARELKSVHVDAIGQYVKLLVHKNHVNKLNLYNQVFMQFFFFVKSS